MERQSSSTGVIGHRSSFGQPATVVALAQQLRRDLAAVDAASGYEPVSNEAITVVARRYGLPAIYQDFLRAVGRTGFVLAPGPFQELVIYAAPDLEAAQIGFRGPRRGDESFVAPHGWRRSWVVIANDSGDPYFLDTNRPGTGGECPIYTAMHGTGTWEPLLAASSLEQFLRILDVWLRIVVTHHDPQNPDEPLDEAQARRLAIDIERIDPAAAPLWAV